MNSAIDRREFRAAINTCITRCQPDSSFAVVVLKLNDLPKLNAGYGYSVTDELLQALHDCLREAVSKSPAIWRLGGSEFGFVVDGVRFPHLLQLGLERVVKAAQGPFALGGATLSPNVSAGASLYPRDDYRADQLFLLAEAALLSCDPKQSNIHIHDPEKDRDTVDHWRLEADLKHALAREQFLLQYQPQLRLGDWQVAGFEALIRWQHPEHGKVPPDRFIPAAESAGYIDTLTEWVVQTSLRETAPLLSGRPELTVSVNVSPSTLFDTGFRYHVESALSLWDCRPENLVVEITESTMMVDFDTSSQILAGLRDRGVRVSIDDFGTGYSSLSYFRRLPADELKIDRSFITGMNRSEGDRKLVEAIITLAHKFDLTVVGEGVEDLPTLLTLRNVGCDVAQGYYIARALGAEELRGWQPELKLPPQAFLSAVPGALCQHESLNASLTRAVGVKRPRNR
jgi:diguanylate cyclase (GGDEF)-like protein